MPRIAVNNINLYYEFHGPEDGEVIVLSNGIMMSTASWYFQTQALAKHFRVLLYDCRGMWQSDHPEGPYSMELHADDLAGLLDALGIDKAQALSWLLVFRLFYYILPFCLGVVLFLKNMGGRLNEKYLGIPQKVIEALSAIVLVWGLRLFGFFLIVSAIENNLPAIGMIPPIRLRICPFQRIFVDYRINCAFFNDIFVTFFAHCNALFFILHQRPQRLFELL